MAEKQNSFSLVSFTLFSHFIPHRDLFYKMNTPAIFLFVWCRKLLVNRCDYKFRFYGLLSISDSGRDSESSFFKCLGDKGPIKSAEEGGDDVEHDSQDKVEVCLYRCVFGEKKLILLSKGWFLKRCVKHQNFCLKSCEEILFHIFIAFQNEIFWIRKMILLKFKI